MPEATPEASNPDGTPTPTSDPTSTAGDTFTPITSQDDLNKLIGERVKRAEAKFGDYKDLKAKASKLDEIELANKSEIDKAMDRVTKAEAEVAELPSKVSAALRTHLIALHEINDDDAELFLTATDPELLLKQVQRLTGREAERKKHGNHVPREGANSTTTEGDEIETLRSLFGGPT